MWDHVFSFPMHTKNIPIEKANLLLKDKFDGESEIAASLHSLIFQKKFLSCNIVYQSLICRLFTLTFIGWIKKWFKAFITTSIHSWVHFLELFISAHKNHDYDQLCDEIESLQRDEDESISDFNSRIIQSYHNDDHPLKKYFDKTMLSLIRNSLTEVEKRCFFNELDFDHEYQEVETNTSFEEPIIALKCIPPSLPPSQDDVLPSINTPLPSYGVVNATSDLVLPSVSRLISIHPC